MSAGIATATDKFRAYDGTDYAIQPGFTDTTITLTTPYAGPSASGVSYAIIQTGSTAARQRDWGTIGNGMSNMGAAFNFNLLEHDPGAYVHNSWYVKRLIYDSMDWLDNNQMDFSVGTTLNNLGQEPYKTEAMKYILKDVSGTSGERP